MLYAAEAGDFNLALLGDIMLTRHLSVGRESAFLSLRNMLVEADGVFANLESSVRGQNEGTPGITAGTHMTMAPELLDDLKWLGISIVSTANNHAFDFGEGGVLATINHLRSAGIPFAGTGENLAVARMPGYVDTPRGRVALVALTSTFRPWNRAGRQGPQMGGRPGVHPLGFATRYGVDGKAMAALRRVGHQLGFDKALARDRQHFFSDKDLVDTGTGEATTVAGQTFFAADRFSIEMKADMEDWEASLRSIREARRQADWVIASFHSHESSGANQITAASRSELDEPAEFMREFARAAIDAGADVVAGHGSHTIRGIEVYKDRPIFYSLGNFVFMNETVQAFPADAYGRFGLGADATPSEFLDARTNNDTKGHPASAVYWRGAVPFCRFVAGRLAEIELLPIDLGYGLPRHQRGKPCIAEGDVARAILERVESLSAPFGTRVERDGDRAVIRLAS